MTLHQRPTLEEFLRWPEQKPYLELIHGTVRPKTVPDFPHSYLQAEMARHLGNWSGASGYTVTEQRCILPAYGESHTVLPDVAWFSRQQLGTPPAGPVRIAPTLAVEVLSPRDRFGDIQEKVMLYLSAGVPVVWVIDPLRRNATVYRSGSPPSLVKPPATLEDPLLTGLTISLVDLFDRLPQPEATQPPMDE